MTVLKLFLEFFKIGLFTFGGGQAMIPLIRDAVLTNGWLPENEFYDFLGVCESTPGPIAINMATYIGAENAGFFGSVMATLGVVLPSFLIILLIAALLKNLTENRFVKGFLKGVSPVITALITATGIILLLKNFGYNSIFVWKFNLPAVICFLVICAVYFIYKAVFRKKMSAVLLIIISAAVGLCVTPILS